MHLLFYMLPILLKNYGEIKDWTQIFRRGTQVQYVINNKNTMQGLPW